MSKKIDLPNGGWAEIAERGELSTRESRKVERRMVAMADLQKRLAELEDPGFSDFNEEELDKVYALQNQTLVSLIREWSYGDLPSVDTIEDLPVDVYEALSKAVNETPTSPSFEPSKEQDDLNPTGNSSGSEPA